MIPSQIIQLNRAYNALQVVKSSGIDLEDKADLECAMIYIFRVCRRYEKQTQNKRKAK